MSRTKILVLVLVLAGLTWAVLELRGSSQDGPAPPAKAAYATSEVSRAKLESVKPAWAQLTEDSRLHDASGMPSEVVDPRTDIVYVLLPAGVFTLGSIDDSGYRDESPASQIRLTQGLYIGREEITVGQYRRFLEASGGAFPTPWRAEEKLNDDLPVVRVSRDEAAEFARWAAARLPIEAEFEYAARGTSDGLKWPWGSDPDPGDARIAYPQEELWFAGTTEHQMLSKVLQPAGASRRDVSWCGARGLAGNVAEWTGSDYDTPFSARPAALGPEGSAGAGSRRSLFTGAGKAVVRGGSWASSIGAARCSNRSYQPPHARLEHLGFRVVRDP